MIVERYETENCEDGVEVHEDGSWTTYTRCSKDPLYSGFSKKAAAASLDLSDQEFHCLIMSDPITFDKKE